MCLRNVPEFTNCEANDKGIRSIESEPPQEKELSKDFPLDRGEAHKICYNPIYRDNTTASSLCYSMRRFQAGTSSASVHEHDLIAEDPTESSRRNDESSGESRLQEQYPSHQLDLSLDNNTNHNDLEDPIQSNPESTASSKSQTNQPSTTSVHKPPSLLIKTLQKSVLNVIGILEGLLVQPSRLDDD